MDQAPIAPSSYLSPRLLLPGSGITPQQIRDLADPLALASTVLTTAPLAEVSEQSLEAY